MASLQALVVSGGRTQRINNADTLLVGVGLDVNAAGTLSIGATTQTAISISRAGILTTVVDDLTVGGNNLNINTVTYAWPGAQGGASTVLTNDGAGNLTWSSAGASSGWTDDGTVVRLTTATDQVAIGTASPAAGDVLTVIGSATGHSLAIAAGTLATNKRALNITATLPATAGTEVGLFVNPTTTAGGTGDVFAIRAILGAGSTTSGTGIAAGAQYINSVAGTGDLNPISNITARGYNAAVVGFLTPTTAGTNLAIRGHAGGSTVFAAAISGFLDSVGAGSTNFGTIGAATSTDNANGVRIGAGGFATNGTTDIGGLFSLQNTTPTFSGAFASAGLIACNGTTSSDIFRAVDDTTIVATIPNGGGFNPGADDTYDLGTNVLRWRDLYLGPATLHIGTSTSDEGVITYDTLTNVLTIASTGTVDVTSLLSVSRTSGDASFSVETTDDTGASYIFAQYNDGGTDNFAELLADTDGASLVLTAEATKVARINAASSALTIEGFASSEIVINDLGQDVNFRIEGDTTPNLFVVDAAQDRVGINRTLNTLGAMLDVDNGASGDSLFILRANGSIVFEADPTGDVTISNASLTVDGDLTLTGIVTGGMVVDTSLAADNEFALHDLSPAALGTTENDYAGANGTSFARLSGAGGGSTITGIAGGSDGRMLIIVNVSANTITLNHQDAGSTASNRIITSTGLAVVLGADDTVVLIYDSVTTRWRQITAMA